MPTRCHVVIVRFSVEIRVQLPSDAVPVILTENTLFVKEYSLRTLRRVYEVCGPLNGICGLSLLSTMTASPPDLTTALRYSSKG